MLFFYENYFTMKSIYESDPNYSSPLIKWGINVSKVRRRAFKSYRKNYDDALSRWPEFRQEYDYSLSLRNTAEPKGTFKGMQWGSFLEKTNFLKFLFPPNTSN